MRHFGVLVALAVAGMLAFGPAAMGDAIIVDDADGSPAFVTDQAWDGTVDRPDYWGTGFVISRNISGTSTATFTPDLPEAGVYDVFMWVPGGASWAWSAAAPVTVNYDGGSDSMTINQEEDTAQWNWIGRYTFAAGTGGSLVLSGEDLSGEWSVADAVKFEYVPEPASLLVLAVGVPLLLRRRA